MADASSTPVATKKKNRTASLDDVCRKMQRVLGNGICGKKAANKRIQKKRVAESSMRAAAVQEFAIAMKRFTDAEVQATAAAQEFAAAEQEFAAAKRRYALRTAPGSDMQRPATSGQIHYDSNGDEGA